MQGSLMWLPSDTRCICIKFPWMIKESVECLKSMRYREASSMRNGKFSGIMSN